MWEGDLTGCLNEWSGLVLHRVGARIMLSQARGYSLDFLQFLDGADARDL